MFVSRKVREVRKVTLKTKLRALRKLGARLIQGGNFRMRWYDAETGRWLSKDLIGLSGGLNLYAFCGGDKGA